MADEKKLHPPQWLGRPILSDEHVQDLETRAAIGEFHHKMPRGEAEQRAHDDYVKEHRERAAAHHLAGMKAAMATGNHEDARKHWALYDLHLKALGKDSIGSVPPEIEKRMMEEHGEKPVYRFKAHKGDLYALHQPSKDVAPPQGQPMQKAEEGPETCHECPPSASEWQHKNRQFHGWKCPHGKLPRAPKGVQAPVEGGGETSEPKTGHLKVVKVESFEKAEAGQCKWKLGERRCQRKVSGSYCHDHVDHWANKIKQKEAQEPMEKAVLPATPPTGAAHLQAPAAAPQLHSTVEGFLGGLKTLPKGSPERGKFLTAHMNHGPFLSALAAHPQGKQVHAMLTQHPNGAQNAGFKAGGTVAVAKSEELPSLSKLITVLLEEEK